MRIIIAGGRDFADYAALRKYCDRILSKTTDIEIVSGTARGADRLGERYAKERGYPVRLFPADWEKFGKSAGYRRNAEMAKYADGLIAFWDGRSAGTGHMIYLAKKNAIKVARYRYKS